MYKKYLLPIQLFLILEKVNVNLFTSKKQNLNNYNIFLNYKYLIMINYLLKNELFLNNSMLIENSAVDLKYYNNLDEKFFFFFNKYKTIIFYNYLNLTTKTKLFFYFFLPNNFNYSINSIDRIFFSANWLERETSEMYGIFFSNKKDHRKLLLDYSSFENPLLKDFPLEGNKQVFFSFFENQVVVQNNKFIEI